MALANSRNNFGLLSSSQEPSQLIAQATNTAKNRKKKEKAKGKKAGSLTEIAEPPRDSNDLEKHAASAAAQQTAPAPHDGDLNSLYRRLSQEAQNADCWSVWDGWLKQIKAESKGVKYKDGKGNTYTFSQALAASSALPRSVSRAICHHMTPTDGDVLAALLCSCLPAVQQSCKQLASVIGEVSEQLDSAPNSTKEAAAAAVEGAVKSFFKACEATADSGMPDLDSLDKEIAAKQPLLQKAISQPDTVQTSTVDMAMQVVQLLHRRYEGEQCLSFGLAPSICAAAKSDTEHLSSILSQHACSASPAATATRDDRATNANVEAAIKSLSQRIAALEVELTGARAELRETKALRDRKGDKNAAATSQASQADKVLAAKHAAQRLESIVMEVARFPSGGVAKNGTHSSTGSAVTDSTLMQLLDFSTHTAQMQDKLMDKLAEQLEFARARLVSASNMKNDTGIANARKLFSNVRAASSETHDSAARLEAMVTSLENAISASPSFSTLRPMAMQVKQIAWQVYNSHNHLSANARPDAILEAASNTKGAAAHNITLDEILQMNVSGKGGSTRQQPQSASSGLSADPTAGASRAATQGSSPAPSTAPPQHMQALPASSPPASAPMAVTMPPDSSMHPSLVFGAQVPNQQGVGIPAGFVGGAQPMHAMIAQPVVAAGGMVAPQVMVAQPAQTSIPLQQYVPGQLLAQDGAPVSSAGAASAPPPGIPAPVAEAPAAAPPPSRFDSQIAAAEAAAANLAKAMAAKPLSGRGGARGRGAPPGRRGGGPAAGRGRR